MATLSRRRGAPRFLVLAPQGLGDALEATPLVVALRSAEPAARIDVLVLRQQSAALFRGLRGLVDNVIFLPYWESGTFAFARALASWWPRRPRYDASFLAYPAARPVYHLLTFLCGARRRFAHRYVQPSVRNLLVLQSDLVPVREAHNVLRNLDLLAAAGYEVDPPQTYAVPIEWRTTSRDSDRFVVHVGSVAHDGLDRKRWPPERFAELACRLLAVGHRVSFLCGPAEREVTLRLHAGVDGSELFEGSLPEVARFLASSGLVICNDNGIAHLAAGVGTPVLSIHGPTPTHFGPFGAFAVRLRPSDCPPCFDPRLLNTDCLLGIDYACLKRDVTVDRVFAEVTKLHEQFARSLKV